MSTAQPRPAQALVALCAAGLVVAACDGGQADGAARRGAAAVTVEAVTVRPVAIAKTLFATGTLESPQSTQVAAEVGGRVVALDVPEGAAVEQGQILARLDDEEARARLSVVRARRRNARDTFERLDALRQRRVISQQELDDAASALDQAAGELEEAETRLRKTAIRAPFAGVLGLRQVSLGAYVEPGDPIVRITQTRPLELVFHLPQRRIGEVAVGQPVRGVVGSCGERFAGRLTAIDPHVDPATRMIHLQAEIPNANGRLLPGMAASVKLEIGRVEDALLVPQEAIVRQGTKTLVFTVGDDAGVAAREVALGEYFVDQVQVTAGLEPGAVVVAAGHQKLRPGARADIVPYQPIENPNLELGAEGAACDF